VSSGDGSSIERGKQRMRACGKHGCRAAHFSVRMLAQHLADRLGETGQAEQPVHRVRVELGASVRTWLKAAQLQPTAVGIGSSV
jgi:hypothetical protein